jgi:hypothetical protein
LTENRNRRLQRALPVLALALVAFLSGAIVGAKRGSSPSVALAERFAAAWARGDYASMYSDISPEARRSISPHAFHDAYVRALATATATGLAPAGRARAGRGGTVSIAMRVQTRLWGTLKLPLVLRTEAGEEDERIAWASWMTFPGLAPGARLSRRVALPRRATLLARDGSVLAESPANGENGRSTPLGELGTAVVGQLGPLPSSRRLQLESEGVPPDAQIGVSGLELALDDRLRGRPGGELVASGGHVLAYTAPRAAPALRTTISPSVQRAAVTALGGQLGGVVAMQPGTGQLLAVAGLGLDGLQPPGSTFKIVTLTAALQAHVATPRTSFPYATHATLDGVRLNNANGEECGGSLALAFAVSCNSVFTPLGVKIGAARLVGTAETFGFNHPSGVPGAPASSLPAASAIQGELAVGSTAIGQAQVLATPLQMLVVAATIADGGRRPAPAFLAQGASHPQRVISAGVAATVRRLMTGVVRSGTGTRAAIPGVIVAGKTGTAELKSSCTSGSESAGASEAAAEHEHEREGCKPGSEANAANTDAWFTAFAPEIHPRIAVCVMLVKDGAGGDTAAPVAREVLEAGLR